MRPCSFCGQHILMIHRSCTHCETLQHGDTQTSQSQLSKSSAIALGLLLGLGSVGCGDEDKDTSADDTATEEPASEPDMAAEYGVPAVESNP
jgi:hypothetical protein